MRVSVSEMSFLASPTPLPAVARNGNFGVLPGLSRRCDPAAHPLLAAGMAHCYAIARNGRTLGAPPERTEQKDVAT